MPQLNPEFFFSQLFWLVITFSFLLLFLWRVSLPRISSVLEKRENKINNDVERAKQLKIEAEEIQNQINQQLRDTHNQTSHLIKDSIINIQHKTSEELLKLDRELTKKINESAGVMENNKKESLKHIHIQIQDIVILTLSKLSSIDVSEREIKESVSSLKSNFES